MRLVDDLDGGNNRNCMECVCLEYFTIPNASDGQPSISVGQPRCIRDGEFDAKRSRDQSGCTAVADQVHCTLHVHA